jgi:hypothetical protein
MARSSRRQIDSQRILYGPPLPPARAPRKRGWGEKYIFRGAVGSRDYVAVEEIVDDNVGIVVAPWPGVDADGGLLFAGEEERLQAVVDRPSFQRRLASRQVLAYEAGDKALSALRARPLAAGDVFAIETRFPDTDTDTDLRTIGARWVRGTIVDVTAMARDAAKAAMLAALTGAPLSVAEVNAIAEPPPPADTEPPTRRGR